MNWSILTQELDRWAAAGRCATLWLRDDDACTRTPALDRLLQTCATHRIPVALAAIPATLQQDLVAAVADAPEVTVLQHGFSHANHAPAGARSAELGADRPLPVIVDELEQGRERLQQAFGARWLPVLVPPWNRIAPAVVERLPGAGFVGLSTFAPRVAPLAAPGLARCNSHVDLVAWRRDRRFVGTDEAVAGIAAHLAARRQGTCDAEEATGVLAHHLQMDEDAWAFLDRLLPLTRAHPAARWLAASAAFSR
ncbi:MAG: polysaccharide deacetylase family protein [Rubrivivax sp.]|nr:polysaccharide deacetylase family protein [Rubrivivax sp.]